MFENPTITYKSSRVMRTIVSVAVITALLLSSIIITPGADRTGAFVAYATAPGNVPVFESEEFGSAVGSGRTWQVVVDPPAGKKMSAYHVKVSNAMVGSASDTAATKIDFPSSNTSTSIPEQVSASAATARAAAEATIKVIGIKTMAKIYVVKGKSVKLPVAVRPVGAANKGVVWSVKNKKIAKINAKTGKLKALKTGKTVVTVKSKDGKKTAKCKVYVVSKAVKLKSLKITPQEATSLMVGKTLQIKTGLSPGKATGIVPKFKSGNPAVAVVDPVGLVTALAPGEAKITVSAGKKKKNFILNVPANAPAFVPVTNITDVPTSAMAGQGLHLTGVVAPANATNYIIEWRVKSAGTTGATIREGTLTATATGSVTVTAEVASGRTATTAYTKDFTIAVNAAPQLQTQALYLDAGETGANPFHLNSLTGTAYTGQRDKYTWDSATKTLTLKGFEWITSDKYALIVNSTLASVLNVVIAPETVNIFSAGNNTVSSGECVGLWFDVKEDVKISGKGTLNVSAGDCSRNSYALTINYGFGKPYKKIHISETTLNATSGSGDIWSAAMIGGFVIDSGKIYAKAGSAPNSDSTTFFCKSVGIAGWKSARDLPGAAPPIEIRGGDVTAIGESWALCVYDGLRTTYDPSGVVAVTDPAVEYWVNTAPTADGAKKAAAPFVYTYEKDYKYLRIFAPSGSGDKGSGDQQNDHGNNVDKTVKVTGVKTMAKIYVARGKSVTLPVTVSPSDAANKGVTWSVKNKKIATINAKTGKLKALKNGSTIVTVTSMDGKKTFKCKVYVVAKAVALKSLKITPQKATSLTVGKTLQIKTKLSPGKATGIVPKYKSSKPAVAAVDAMGNITALTPGKTTIKVTAGKLKKTFVLNVRK